ncbi:hypothetical protein An16g05850 [Aspergillus niger]|uniref:Uncharacterized protein n=2 Tax=Aspergillus niger TaxID=5061 RepID=A2R851_ASPNC|nr:hypothetical protein An16g05850 [Aspergillus niger]CAK46925.1 hypothetical protein An16g05850 [Aspergillus niger]
MDKKRVTSANKLYSISLPRQRFQSYPPTCFRASNIQSNPLPEPTTPSLSVARCPTLRRDSTNTFILAPGIARSTGCAVRVANAVGPMSFGADAVYAAVTAVAELALAVCAGLRGEGADEEKCVIQWMDIFAIRQEAVPLYARVPIAINGTFYEAVNEPMCGENVSNDDGRIGSFGGSDNRWPESFESFACDPPLLSGS